MTDPATIEPMGSWFAMNIHDCGPFELPLLSPMAGPFSTREQAEAGCHRNHLGWRVPMEVHPDLVAGLVLMMSEDTAPEGKPDSALQSREDREALIVGPRRPSTPSDATGDGGEATSPGNAGPGRTYTKGQVQAYGSFLLFGLEERYGTETTERLMAWAGVIVWFCRRFGGPYLETADSICVSLSPDHLRAVRLILVMSAPIKEACILLECMARQQLPSIVSCED